MNLLAAQCKVFMIMKPKNKSCTSEFEKDDLILHVSVLGLVDEAAMS